MVVVLGCQRFLRRLGYLGFLGRGKESLNNSLFSFFDVLTRRKNRHILGAIDIVILLLMTKKDQKMIDDFFEIKYRKKGQKIDIDAFIRIATELNELEEENRRAQLRQLST